MKIMKNTAALVLLACLMLSLCACGGAETPETTAAPTTEALSILPATEAAEVTEDDGMTIYTVTILDDTGAPIPGAMVQLCMDTCYPGIANDEGVATFSVPEGDYKVSFLVLPAGFTYADETQEFYFDNGSTEMTITLKAA